MGADDFGSDGLPGRWVSSSLDSRSSMGEEVRVSVRARKRAHRDPSFVLARGWYYFVEGVALAKENRRRLRTQLSRSPDRSR